MISVLVFILIIVFMIIVGSFIPIGNERSTVRRLPVVTFSIMAVNVIIFSITFPIVAGEMEDLSKLGTELERHLKQHPELLVDDRVRTRLTELGVMHQLESDAIADQLKASPALATKYKEWLRTREGEKLRNEFNQKLTTYKDAVDGTVWHQYGLAPNGTWRLHQLLTSAFPHNGMLHLMSNMLFFFAVAFSLEDLWGRGGFLGFYMMGAAASVTPYILSPLNVPLVGASGAVAATLGAFLFRLPKTKIKLFCVPSLIRRVMGKQAITVMVPGYIYLVAYFIAQVVDWYFDKQAGNISGVAYSVHIAGFIFGACFAVMMKVTRIEELYLNPLIESKISFSAAPAITQALEALDGGDALTSERKLMAHLVKNPDDTNAMLTAVQVFQRTSNFEKLNGMYGRLIRLHLKRGDKEAALYAYDSLLSAFPDDNVAPRIPASDWLALCEYLRESGMNREAAVEYERLVKACPDDPLASLAAVKGGEAALFASDVDRALWMFEKAESLKVSEPYASRAHTGIEKCNRIMEQRPKWAKRQQNHQIPAEPVKSATGDLSPI
jgi:membrane associated rhomboid family serine protease